MALTAELRTKLLDEDEPPKKRLCLVHNVFISQQFRVERKEEVALESLCNMLNSKSNINTWETLLLCMTSARMKNMHSVDIQPAVKKMLINVLKSTLASKSATLEIKCLAAKCALIVLQDPCMEHYLSRKSKEFIELCTTVLEYLSSIDPSSSSVTMGKQVVSIILDYHRKQPQELNFRSKFLSCLFMPLVKVESAWSEKEISKDEKNIEHFSGEILKCLQTIAISKQHQEMYESILDYILGLTKYTDYTTDALLIQVNKCNLQYSSEEVASVLSIILHAFALSYKKTPDLVVKMFVVQCYVLGLRPITKENALATVDEKRLQELLGSDTFLSQASIKKATLNTLQAMLEVLAKEEVIFENCNFGNETGREWLARLSTHMLSSVPTNLAESAIAALCPLSSIDLLLLENFIPDIILWISTLFESKEVNKAFHLVISEALKAADKQQRVHKLIGKLLDGLKLGIDNNITKELIPDSFLEELEKCCVTMHSKHVANLLSSILFHLEQNCVNIIPNRIYEASNGDKVFLHIVSRLLYSVLLTSRSAQHTTAAPVLEKFCSQMEVMASLLARLEKVLCTMKPDADTMEPLLVMCVAWGEVRLMLLHYVGIEGCFVVSIIPPNENPFSLSRLHTYLNNKEWVQLSKKAATLPNCSKLMVDLVAQKFRACVLLNLVDKDSTLSSMAHVLTTQGTPGPLHPSLGMLVPLLDEKTKKKLAKSIANDLLCNGPWCQLLNLPLEQSCEKFVGNIALHIISVMKESNFGCNSSVLDHLNIKKIETESLEAMASSLCEELQSCSPTQTCPELASMLCALDKLPLKQLPKSVRCASALAVLASCSSLKDSWTLPDKVLIKLLGNTGKDTPLPASMNYGQLINWLLNSMKNDLESPMLQSTFVSALLGNISTAPESLAKGIKIIKKTLQITPTSIAASVCNFLLPYIHNRVENKESKNYDIFKKCEQNLSLLVLHCSLTFKSDSLLPALCTALLAVEDSELVNQGLELLPDLLSEVVTKNFTEPVVAVLECVVALPVAQREKIMPQLWQYLCLAPDLPPAGYNCLQKLLETASQKQTEFVVSALLGYELEVGFGLWKLLVQMCSGDKKELQWLRKLQSAMRLSLLRWDTSDSCLNNKILPSFDLLISLAKGKAELEPTMLDLLLDSVLALQLDKRDIEHGLIPALKSAISLVNCLLTSRGGLLLERIPVLQQRLALLATTVAQSAPPTLNTELANQLAGCAHSIEGIGVGIHRYKKDFARVASYMAADILNIFEHHNIHHAVKTHLEKYLHTLLRLCDEHAEHFLLGVLSPASQQLLKSELKQCKKEKQIRV